MWLARRLVLLGTLTSHGCASAPSTVFLDIQSEPGLSAPEELRLTIYDDLGSGAPVSARRLPEAGAPTLPSSVVLYPRAGATRLRILIRASQASKLLGEGAALVSPLPGQQVRTTVVIRRGPLPDRDGDGVPDAIDNCPGKANPDQVQSCGGPDLASDAPTRDGPRADAPSDLRDLPSTDRGKADAKRDQGKKKPDAAKPDVKLDAKKPDVKKLDLPKPDLPKPKPDAAKPADLPKPDQTTCSISNFGFAAVAHQPPSTTLIYDNNGGITVQGTCSASATVSGGGNPAFDINGSGVWLTSGTVQVGQKLRLRATSPSAAGAKISPTLTVGTRSASWSITTCSGATCMVGAIGANSGCNTPSTRVHRWTCPGSSEWIYASDFTLQFSGTGLLTCPAGASCEWEQCGGNGWQTATLACP